MAWIYLAESVASQSHSIPGLKQPLIVNKTDSLNPFYYQEWQKESCTKRQSGMMCKRSLEKCCRQLTLFSVASHAKISVLQVMEQAWKESEAVYSTKLSDLQKKFSRLLCSSKTSPQLELADFEKSSEHLPKFGMTAGGLVYLPQALELHTSANAGSYLPTPVAIDTGTRINKGGAQGRVGKDGPTLGAMAKFNLWPTPCARDWKDSPNQKFRDERDTSKLPMMIYKQDNSGQLNPQFVEWLMGYTLEWTELSAWVIPWFRNKSEKRLRYSQESKVSA